MDARRDIAMQLGRLDLNAKQCEQKAQQLEERLTKAIEIPSNIDIKGDRIRQLLEKRQELIEHN